MDAARAGCAAQHDRKRLLSGKLTSIRSLSGPGSSGPGKKAKESPEGEKNMHRVRKVEIEKTEKYIAWTDVQGTRHEYERPLRPMQLHVQELRARQAFLRPTLPTQFEFSSSHGPAPETPLQLSFTGMILLEDQGLEVIGFPETKSRLLSVEFREQGPDISPGPPVMLGCRFNSKEAENAHGWWLSVLLPPLQFQAVADAMASRQLSKLGLSLQLDNLYIREWLTSPEGKTCWYLPPESDPRGGAKVATGTIQALSVETAAMDLRPPPPDEIETELLKQDTDYRPPTEDKLAHAVAMVADKVGSLQTVLKFMALGLLILVLVIGRKF